MILILQIIFNLFILSSPNFPSQVTYVL
jgi:hypothetical protein